MSVARKLYTPKEYLAFERASDGVQRCLPEGQAQVNPTYFSDSGCSHWLMVAPAGCDAGLVKYAQVLGAQTAVCLAYPTASPAKRTATRWRAAASGQAA